MTYSAVRKLLHRHYLRQMEVPAEHAVSLPFPTLRWHRPAYAFFAGPASRVPGTPLRQWPPDRWWALDAANGELLTYNLCSVAPLAAAEWPVVDMPAPADSVAGVKQLLVDIEQMSDELAAAFLAGECPPESLRDALAGILTRMFPPTVLDQCRAVAPDYCHWLRLAEEQDPSSKTPSN